MRSLALESRSRHRSVAHAAHSAGKSRVAAKRPASSVHRALAPRVSFLPDAITVSRTAFHLGRAPP